MEVIKQNTTIEPEDASKNILGVDKIKTLNLYNLNDIKSQLKHDITIQKTFLGLLVFIVIFAILIPIVLIKKKSYDFLESYMPNLDLIAGLVSFEKGILPGYLFLNLYQSSPISLPAFLSQVSINYMALLGVTFLIARETLLTKSIAKGWSIGLVMLLVTYLLPGQFISSGMSKMNEVAKEYLDKHNITSDKVDIPYIISLLVGLCLTVGIILFEKFIIKNTRHYLEKVGKLVVNFPTLI